jgi:hypothetical protein
MDKNIYREAAKQYLVNHGYTVIRDKDIPGIYHLSDGFHKALLFIDVPGGDIDGQRTGLKERWGGKMLVKFVMPHPADPSGLQKLLEICESFFDDRYGLDHDR